MKTINIGIVAHVDAGKTSLTERILFETNVIDQIGQVDKGNTQTDSMELERQRGITIKASVVSFLINDTKVNLIDTPGHADFIAEVERSFRVLDGAILVISAVEGVQAQTKVLMRTLQKLRIPTMIFINKIDRGGAHTQNVIKQIRETLSENILPFYQAIDEGTKYAAIYQSNMHEAYIEVLAPHNESLLESYVNGDCISEATLQKEFIHHVQQGNVYPVFLGSAMTGIGISELLERISMMIPPTPRTTNILSGVVFKIEREPSGEKVAYIRLFSGFLYVRKDIDICRDNALSHREKVKKLHIFQQGTTIQVPSVHAGEFCKVWGLHDIKIGDVVGEVSHYIKDISFVKPQMEAMIQATQQGNEHALFEALTELAEEDPLIHIWKDDIHQELYIRLFGDVQKEVVEATLRDKYGLEIRFSATRIVCIEKPLRSGHVVEQMGERTNPFYATIGLSVKRGPSKSGITYQLDVELGSLPLSFHKAIEETVHQTLKQGLYGWEVTDIIVTLTHSGYGSSVSTAGDFRNLTPLVLMEALKQAGTTVFEPINEFELTAPTRAISTAIYRLSAMQATFTEPMMQHGSFHLTGTLPMAKTEEFKRGLYSFTEGEGVFLAKPYGYKELTAPFPTRKRVDYNPLNRKDYLLHVLRTY
ncbi:tetracycline resistance ribosomal protection protein [Priestia taiwanensis]|uniref:Tetracycline resistance protein n=1 Tax=Priestia taiwanensis TaxID=1347902 RepID=A0A917ASY7_9BACI|nr:tetracycline resistance ribosomal protection protein [Priestia taiwanensis]MBM7363976.1 ribosomal protection tetracycline resistance protein [Priestia taiwanensis]GGE70651.1 tetracycline resistance protein [Priestia taiwanensis]